MSARNLKLVLTPATQNDLANLLTYTERHWGPSQRKAYDQRIDHTFTHLAQFPELGRIRPDYGPEVRSHHVGQHVIIYEPTNSELRVLRLLHVRRDIDADLD